MFLGICVHLEMSAHVLVIFNSGIMRLDARARQDVAILGSEFLKLDGKFSFLCALKKCQSGLLVPYML